MDQDFRRIGENILAYLKHFFTGFSLPLPDGKTKSRPLVEKHLKGLVQTGPIPRISDPVGLGWAPRICISNKFLGNADAAGHEAML